MDIDNELAPLVDSNAHPPYTLMGGAIAHANAPVASPQDNDAASRCSEDTLTSLSQEDLNFDFDEYMCFDDQAVIGFGSLSLGQSQSEPQNYDGISTASPVPPLSSQSFGQPSSSQANLSPFPTSGLAPLQTSQISSSGGGAPLVTAVQGTNVSTSMAMDYTNGQGNFCHDVSHSPVHDPHQSHPSQLQGNAFSTMNQSSTASSSPDGNHSHLPIMTSDLGSFFQDGNPTSSAMCKAVYQENQQPLRESVVQTLRESKKQRLMQSSGQAIQGSEPQSSEFSKNPIRWMSSQTFGAEIISPIAPSGCSEVSIMPLNHDRVKQESPPPKACKRPRKALRITKRLEIINFVKENPDMSVLNIADHFGMPRPTVYGILKSKDKLLAQPRHLIGDSCRVGESRLKIMEELMVMWCENLISQQIHYKIATATAQAVDIHRMLSSLLREPLPHCLFTSGWYKGFEKRRQIKRIKDKKANVNGTESMQDLGSFQSLLQMFEADNIYVCESTSMFLGMISMRLQDTESNNIDSSSASVVLCFNTSGTDKREPLVLVRQSQSWTGFCNTIHMPTQFHEPILGTRGEDLHVPTVLSWLVDFDRSLRRQILLVVDGTMWELLNRGRKNFQSILRNICVLRAPATMSTKLPISAGLAKIFKATYYKQLFQVLQCEEYSGRTDLDRLEQYIPLVLKAWGAIKRSFIMELNPFTQKRQSGTGFSIDVKSLKNDLKKAYPDASDTAIAYFDNLEKETGPSSFLREKIQLMKNHNDFSECFENPNFGTVRILRLDAKGPCNLTLHNGALVPYRGTAFPSCQSMNGEPSQTATIRVATQPSPYVNCLARIPLSADQARWRSTPISEEQSEHRFFDPIGNRAYFRAVLAGTPYKRPESYLAQLITTQAPPPSPPPPSSSSSSASSPTTLLPSPTSPSSSPSLSQLSQQEQGTLQPLMVPMIFALGDTGITSCWPHQQHQHQQQHRQQEPQERQPLYQHQQQSPITFAPPQSQFNVERESCRSRVRRGVEQRTLEFRHWVKDKREEKKKAKR